MKLFIPFFLSFILPSLSLYNVSYFRSLEKVEEEIVLNKYVNLALYKLEHMMITYAKNGYNEISIKDCDYNYNLIDHNIINYDDLTPKDYNYLKPQIIKQIEEKVKNELCSDCMIHKKRVNDCNIYTILW